MDTLRLHPRTMRCTAALRQAKRHIRQEKLPAGLLYPICVGNPWDWNEPIDECGHCMPRRTRSRGRRDDLDGLDNNHRFSPDSRSCDAAKLRQHLANHREKCWRCDWRWPHANAWLAVVSAFRASTALVTDRMLLGHSWSKYHQSLSLSFSSNGNYS